VYSAIRESDPESLRFGGPTSSMPPAAPRPLIAATAPPLSLDKVPVIRVSPGEIAKAPLDHRAGFVLSLIDSMSSLDLIVDASGMPSADVLRIIEQLLAMSIIELR
jgi:hypothetical protein